MAFLRFLFIDIIIKDANMTCILFSVKYSVCLQKKEVFTLSQELFPLCILTHYPQIGNLKITEDKSNAKARSQRELLYLNPYFLNGWGYFSLCQMVFQQEDKYSFRIFIHLQQSLYAVVQSTMFACSKMLSCCTFRCVILK